jgi:hypothetical protein
MLQKGRRDMLWASARGGVAPQIDLAAPWACLRLFAGVAP